MANRFTQYTQTRYDQLPIDYYQQALGVQEQKTAGEVNDLGQNVQFVRNMPAVGGPDSQRLQQLHDQIDQGISGIAKKDLSAADTLNDLQTLITDKTLNNDATGIYQNVLGFRKKQQAIQDYKEKFGNNVNTIRLEDQMNKYLSSNDPSKFKAGYFDSLQNPTDYIDIEGEVAKLAKDFKANKYVMENSNGHFIKKTLQEGLSENELYNKAYQYVANNPKYANQFQENTFYNAYNTGQGDTTKGYQTIATDYQSQLDQKISKLAQARDSGKIPSANKQAIQDQINQLSQQKQQVSDAINKGNYQAVAAYKTKEDIIAGGSKPFAWNDTEQSLKADPYGLIGYKEAMSFDYWKKKNAVLQAQQNLPVNPMTVFEGLSQQQAEGVADDQITKDFGMPVSISSDGTKIEFNSNSAKAFRQQKYYQELKDLRTKLNYQPGILNFFSDNSQYSNAVKQLNSKYGVDPDGTIKDIPEDLAPIKTRLNDLAQANPSIKNYTDKGDYVSAFKTYRDALTNNQKIMEAYAINRATGFDENKLKDLMAGLASQPAKLLSPDGKGITKFNNINEALQQVGAINAKTKWSDVQNMLYNKNNQLTWRKDGMISLQVSTPTGVQKILITPPSQMLDQFQGLAEVANSTKQGILNFMGGNYITTPKVINGKIQQVVYQPVSQPEQLYTNKFSSSSTFHIIENTIGAQAASKISTKLSKLSSNADSNTYLFDSAGNIVDEGQVDPRQSYIGVTLQNNKGIKSVVLSKLATDPQGKKLDVNKMFDYKFMQSTQPGGILSGFRATNKESTKNLNPYNYDPDSSTRFSNNDTDQEDNSNDNNDE